MVLSMNPNKKRIIALCGALVVLTAAVLFMPNRNMQAGTEYSRAGETADERLAFLEQFGWEVEAEPLEVREIHIPEEFDDVYTRYNELQKSQGLDLLPYADKTCRQWIYRVLTYPQSGEEVRAILLVYDGLVIGGDISSVKLNGFMTGFAGELKDVENSQEDAEKQAEDTDVMTEEIPEDAWPTD